MQNPLSYYRQLLEKYLYSAVSAGEANELFDFMAADPEEAKALMEEFRDVDLSDRFKHLENISEQHSRRMFSRLKNAIAATQDEQPATAVHRVHFLKTSWFRYAAAVFVIAVTALLFLLFKNDKKGKEMAAAVTPPQTDIVAGSDKAVLTLADGSRIVLDESKNGNLAQQGNARVMKLDSGRLTYQVDRGVAAKPSFNTLTVPRGGQYALTLSDGTRVWLNADSYIRYPTVFNGPERVVEISGEAYMEIAKNNKQPFIVNANGTEVLALGTSFNVNAYPDEGGVKTTLIDGGVRVRKLSSTEAKVLGPGQQAIVTGNIDFVKVESVDTEQVLAWRNGFFSFNNADIKTIMRQISRWYNINIIYEKGVPEQRFFGEMSRNLSLSQVLKGLEVTKINFRLEGRNLIVMP
ncbi:FecR family protein [Pseudoflavitalea rhizosphaerae]|uniref:FecR family protein n=1 Tax=Pseudoflavitalea rhizosphaerae TaxID=1884793 RepID=UPI000F8D4926|nr:FecR family protein [Pseudoflavitalea rhizosphaerae]